MRHAFLFFWFWIIPIIHPANTGSETSDIIILLLSHHFVSLCFSPFSCISPFPHPSFVCVCLLHTHISKDECFDIRSQGSSRSQDPGLVNTRVPDQHLTIKISTGAHVKTSQVPGIIVPATSNDQDRSNPSQIPPWPGHETLKLVRETSPACDGRPLCCAVCLSITFYCSLSVMCNIRSLRR